MAVLIKDASKLPSVFLTSEMWLNLAASKLTENFNAYSYKCIIQWKFAVHGCARPLNMSMTIPGNRHSNVHMAAAIPGKFLFNCELPQADQHAITFRSSNPNGFNAVKTISETVTEYGLYVDGSIVKPELLWHGGEEIEDEMFMLMLMRTT